MDFSPFTDIIIYEQLSSTLFLLHCFVFFFPIEVGGKAILWHKRPFYKVSSGKMFENSYSPIMTVIKFILQGHEVDSLSWRVSDLIKNIMTGEREKQTF